MTDELRQYLRKTHSPATTRIYLFDIGHYLRHTGEQAAQKAQYPDLIRYFEYIRQRYDKPATVNRIIHALKQYYQYLIHAGMRNDHPCRYFSIRDQCRAIQVQDLLSPQQLQLMLQRTERYAQLQTRNQVILSLLVYQALLPQEMARLQLGDVDLEQALIQIQASHRTHGRSLAMHPTQIMTFYRYIHHTRPQLLKTDTQALIITARGTAEKGEGIHYLVETFRPLMPNKKLTPTTIRQSVIANMLKAGKGLRQVQLFAGHKYISTTEQYRQNNLEQLKHQIHKYHPLADQESELPSE